MVSVRWSVEEIEISVPYFARTSATDHCQPTTDHSPLVVFDEFTSAVDRNVARIGSAAVAKTFTTPVVNGDEALYDITTFGLTVSARNVLPVGGGG